MTTDLKLILLRAFMSNSGNCISSFVNFLRSTHTIPRDTTFFLFEKGRRKDVNITGEHFFLRTSTEYSNPQLNLEDLQGILISRMLEVSANFLLETGEQVIHPGQIQILAEKLSEPSTGKVVPFLLNTDDVEPDRYSVNPLRESIVASGQSAFPVARVSTEKLELDRRFVQKYKGSLVEEKDLQTIEFFLENSSSDRYVDFVDSVKYDQLAQISERLGIHLSLPALRMPLTTLANGTSKGSIHKLIEISHANYENVRRIYELMGRNILKHKSLLPAVPHAQQGFGSKKAGRGKLEFENQLLKEVQVKYRPTFLYPNEVDKSDISVAKAHEDVTVAADRLRNYDSSQLLVSPQFALYATLSPENAAIWHGVGKYAGSEIVASYTSVQAAHATREMFSEIPKPHLGIPAQFDLTAERMIAHPRFRNIDASVNCLEELTALLPLGTHLRTIQPEPYIRRISE